MFLKLDLFVICAVLFCTSEVKSDCDDFISCVGTWIGDLLVNDKKGIAVKTVEVSDTLSDVSDILSNISQLIEEKFDSVTKETSLVKHDDRTIVHVETFKVNNSLDISNQQLKVTSTELPKTVEGNAYQPKETNQIVNNILVNVILNANENQTTNANVHEKVNDLNVTTENVFVATEFVEVLSTTNWNYSAINYVIEETSITNKDDPYKVPLGEYFVNKTNELGTENNKITSDLTITNKKVAHELPVNTFIELNNASNIEQQNVSNIYINIPKNVASNYKITFESPINVTYLEINTEVEKKLETPNKTITNITFDNNDNVKDDIEHQNILENEIIVTDDEFDYNTENINATDYLAIDYIEIYKDTTNEEVAFTLPLYTSTTTQATSPANEVTEANGIESTYPWIAAVFIKNNDNNQFEYICDGGLMSDKVVLTAARCVMKSNATEDVSNILVILGKRSLQATGPNEKVLRVKSVKLHENFTATEGRVDNDLAIIVLAGPIMFNDEIQPVPWKNDEFDAIQSATTGWHVTGRLTPIYFEAGSSKTCKKESEALNTFCATFGDDITTCPSFGGLFVSRRADSEWCLQGIATGNPTSRGVCFNKNVSFTNISNYYQWIIKHVDDNKDS